MYMFVYVCICNVYVFYRKELNKANNGEWRGFRTKMSTAIKVRVESKRKQNRKILLYNWYELFTIPKKKKRKGKALLL